MKEIIKRIGMLVLLTVWMSVAASAKSEFAFQIAADGKTEKTVVAGDCVTVTFVLERTDAQEPFPMYAMQNEICYDSTFFRLVEGSVLTEANIRTNDISMRDHHRAFYMNTLSLGENALWNANTLVGSFQLEVIGTTGVTEIYCNNPKVSRPNGSGSYNVAANTVTVEISKNCSVVFETDGGSAVETRIVKQGQALSRPAEPTRHGYRFDGWYRDIDRKQAWNFAADTVDKNLHLYAKWVKEANVSSFVDVSVSDWFVGDVEYVFANGLMDGVGGGAFAPYQNTSRAMIVTVLWRMEGKPVNDSVLSFTDVPSGQWYTEAIRWAADKGIVTGYSAQVFGPNDSITREQLAAILYRYAGYKGHDVSSRADLHGFTDLNKVSAWARDALSWANGKGLINGMPDGTLDPLGKANRCQTAAILHRFCIQH